jgi:hypothetical protein
MSYDVIMFDFMFLIDTYFFWRHASRLAFITAISREQPRIEASVPVKFLGGTENEVQVTARLDVDSSVRLTETYESATVLGNSIDLPQAVQYSRDLYVTYVDEDLLVVRDASGVPEVLVRK